MFCTRIRKIFNKYGWKGTLRIIDSRYGLGRIEHALATNWFNPFATMWINLRSLPIRQALHFPIWAYGRPRLFMLSGSIIVEGRVRTGMIKFNKVRSGAPSIEGLQTELLNYGTIIFEGSGVIGTGNKIFVASGAVLRLGRDFIIADMVNIGCYKSIICGELSRITHRCQIMDTNYHFIADFNKRVIPSYVKPIIIGRCCWICNSTTITSGANIPDYTIVASNSLVNKALKNIPENSIVGGIPAKLISTGYRKVFNSRIEKSVHEYLAEHPEGTFSIPDEIAMSDCSEL